MSARALSAEVDAGSADNALSGIARHPVSGRDYSAAAMPASPVRPNWAACRPR